jgi:hypothetical protein
MIFIINGGMYLGTYRSTSLFVPVEINAFCAVLAEF